MRFPFSLAGRIDKIPLPPASAAFPARIWASRTVAAFGILVALCAPARADLLDDVLGVLNAAGVIDSAVVEAKPLLQCMIDGKSVEYCAENVAKPKGIKIAAGDPKVKKVLDIFKAVKEKDWITVFNLSSEQVVCGLVPGGAVKDLFCGEIFKVAKPVIGKAYNAVNDGDWWDLVALLGPSAACEIMPGGEVKSAVCGTLGKALAEIGKFAVGGANAGKDALIDLGETLSGQTQHMPPEKYYELYWHPFLHVDVLIILRGGKASHTLEYEHCVGYFDSHKASEKSGEKWCGKMRSQLGAERDAIVAAMKAAPAAYFAAKMKPRIPEFALDYYHGISPGKFPGTQLSGTCGTDIGKMIPIPAITPMKHPSGPKWTSPPYTAWQWACGEVLGKLTQEVYPYKQQVVNPVLGKLAADGCPVKPSVSYSALKDTLFVKCDTFDAVQTCRKSLLGKPVTLDQYARHCEVDSGAHWKLAEKIVKTLGAKRCRADHLAQHIVSCTRPWKLEACQAMVADASQGFTTGQVQVYCKSKDQLAGEPAYSVVKKQAQDVLNTLNGVKKAGKTVGPDGKTDEMVLVPPTKVCTHGFDPLAISCPGNPNAPAMMGVQLAMCAPDPNKDGADAPCFSGPLSIKDAAAGPLKAASATPAAAGGNAGSSSSGRIAAPPGKTSPGSGGIAVKVPAGPMAALPGLGVTSQKPAVQGGTTPAPSGGPASSPDGRLASQGTGRAAAAAEIRSGPRVLVAGKFPVAWGQGITIQDTDARRKLNGICEVALGHDAINSGVAVSSPFARRWTNQQNPVPLTDSYPPLPAGGTLPRTDTLSLKPGVNQLTLSLDPLNQVKEGNEGDNIYRVTITVIGSCGMSQGEVPGARPGGQAAPATRTPAVQQPQVPPSPVQPRLNLPR